MTRSTMIVTHMGKYILLLRLIQFIEWVLIKVIMKAGKMDKCTSEFIDGSCPSL